MVLNNNPRITTISRLLDPHRSILFLQCCSVTVNYPYEYGVASVVEPGSSIWVQRLLCHGRLSYPVVSILSFFALFVLFVFFIVAINAALDISTLIQITAISGAIGFQLLGICTILTDFSKGLESISIAPLPDDLQKRFEAGVGDSRKYLLTVLFFVSFFTAIEVVQYVVIELFEVRDLAGVVTLPRDYPLFAFAREPTLWSALFDIFNQTVTFINIILLATMVWILLNVVSTLSLLSRPEHRQCIALDMLCIDKIGGLRQLRGSAVKSHAIYSFTITLLILSYFNPFSIKITIAGVLYRVVGISCETFLFILLLVLGLYFIIGSIRNIRKITRSHIEEQIGRINEKYYRNQKKLLDLISDEPDGREQSEIALIKVTLDSLYTERERLLKLYSDSKGYSLSSVVQLISIFILPVITFCEKISIAVIAMMPK